MAVRKNLSIKRNEIIQMWKEGLTDKEIAKEFDVNRSDIGYWRQKWGLSKRKQESVLANKQVGNWHTASTESVKTWEEDEVEEE
jgi:FixJ family two-component response regulator